MADYLRVEGLRKAFGREIAVAGITFGVEKGKILTLLGPSGCGKTTTLRCIAGLEHPDAGTITIDGEPVTSVAEGILASPEQRNVGMVFQSYAVWPHMTVAQNVGFPLEVRKWPRTQIAARVDQVLELVELRRFRDQYTTRLSGGQQQRVALARALVANPRLLLFDEPLSNLDAKLREQLRTEIVRLQRESGITAVYVTHDQAEAMVISDHIIIMNLGSIEQQGDARTIYTRPANRFVAEFIGLANLVPGVVMAAPGGDGWLRVEVLLGGAWRAALRALLPRGEVAPGDTILLSIRPEDVRVCAAGTAAGENVLEGTVARAVYMGNYVDYLVAVGEVRLRVQTNPSAIYQEGDHVGLKLPPQSCVCIPEGSHASQAVQERPV